MRRRADAAADAAADAPRRLRWVWIPTESRILWRPGFDTALDPDSRHLRLSDDRIISIFEWRLTRAAGDPREPLGCDSVAERVAPRLRDVSPRRIAILATA